MRGMALLCMALILPLYSCTLGTWIVGEGEIYSRTAMPGTYDFSAYYRSFDNPWVGRTRDELVDALGPPDAVFEARPRFADYWEAGIPAYTYIYGGAGSSGRCIDAYVVEEPTSTVIKYYCR